MGDNGRRKEGSTGGGERQTWGLSAVPVSAVFVFNAFFKKKNLAQLLFKVLTGLVFIV